MTRILSTPARTASTHRERRAIVFTCGQAAARLGIAFLVLGLFGFPLTQPAFAQVASGGTIRFSNLILPLSNNCRVYDVDGATPLAGDTFRAELCAGSTPQTMAPVGTPASFFSGLFAGYWNPAADAIVHVPSIAPGQPACVQVRVWDHHAGATYELALAAGGRTGRSRLFTIVTGGSGSPPTLPASLDGLTPFHLSVRPPSGVTLGPDLDGDGLTDLVWRHTDGTVSTWLLNGTNVRQVVKLGQVHEPGWRVAATGDFDHDGQTDLLWQHTDGRLAVWLLNGTALKQGAWLERRAPAGATLGAVADCNADGQSDLVWQKTDGSLEVWLMDGLRVRKSVAVEHAADPDWRLKGAGDFNGDGQTDLLLQHTDGTIVAWLLDGLTVQQEVEIGQIANPAWRIAGTGDFNADASTDILWRHADGTVVVWLLRGTTVFQGLTIGRVADPNWSIVGPE